MLKIKMIAVRILVRLGLYSLPTSGSVGEKFKKRRDKTINELKEVMTLHDEQCRKNDEASSRYRHQALVNKAELTTAQELVASLISPNPSPEATNTKTTAKAKP